MDQTIEKVSFCAPDRNHEKGFSYICRDGTTRRWMCHGFLASKDSVNWSLPSFLFYLIIILILIIIYCVRRTHRVGSTEILSLKDCACLWDLFCGISRRVGQCPTRILHCLTESLRILESGEAQRILKSFELEKSWRPGRCLHLSRGCRQESCQFIPDGASGSRKISKGFWTILEDSAGFLGDVEHQMNWKWSQHVESASISDYPIFFKDISIYKYININD